MRQGGRAIVILGLYRDSMGLYRGLRLLQLWGVEQKKLVRGLGFRRQ